MKRVDFENPSPMLYCPACNGDCKAEMPEGGGQWAICGRCMGRGIVSLESPWSREEIRGPAIRRFYPILPEDFGGASL